MVSDLLGKEAMASGESSAPLSNCRLFMNVGVK
jgi:hypothetical protein